MKTKKDPVTSHETVRLIYIQYAFNYSLRIHSTRISLTGTDEAKQIEDLVLHTVCRIPQFQTGTGGFFTVEKMETFLSYSIYVYIFSLKLARIWQIK
jgi:hypothetical protein